MRKALFIFLLFPFLNLKAESKADSLVYQFGNDTILQTLVIKWNTDTSFDYRLLSQDLMDRGSVSILGKAYRSSKSDEPFIWSCPGNEFPAILFEAHNGDCRLNFYVQYQVREKVWVDQSCARKPMFPHAPLKSVGVMEVVVPR